MTKLNPCPDCGREPDLREGGKVSRVACRDCGSTEFITARTASGATNAWNAATNGEQAVKTLRDEFAMAVMQAIRSGPEWQLLEMKSIAANNSLDLEGVISHFAYKQADAMMQERSK